MRKAEIIRLIREKATEICDTTTERVVGGGLTAIVKSKHVFSQFSMPEGKVSQMRISLLLG